ncbi:MAG: holo-[acyl-carrier-protein] synthase [candidate division Zixibacteria bacterium]|nr:holo-[acyl-carrier-protein] synthase [candidate division Zixibacteria bacterium]
MVKAIGIDIIEIERIKNVIDKWGDRFLRKVYTPWEISYCQEKAYPEYSFAARFAVKEAVFKALGGGTEIGIKWTSIEVVNHRSGKPMIKMGGKVKEIVGEGEILISISHTHRYAVAQALLLEG